MHPSHTGRIFFGIAIIGMGVLTLCYGDFPYMLIPAEHSRIPGLALLTSVSGTLLVFAGTCITIKKMIRTVSLLLGGILILIFCFYFTPYQLIVSANAMHFGDWENAAKELTLCGGAFILVNFFSEKDKQERNFWKTLAASGVFLFSLTIISFSINHFLYAHEAAAYVPSWIPGHLFCIYAGGIALLGSGLAIMLNIWRAGAANLLGLMIFIWFILLHVPRIITSSAVDLGDEVTSALVALACSGTSFVIAGLCKKDLRNLSS